MKLSVLICTRNRAQSLAATLERFFAQRFPDHYELVIVDKPGLERAIAWIGLPAIDASNNDYAAFEVADMIIGGDDGSRVAIDLSAIENTARLGSSSIWTRWFGRRRLPEPS